MFDFATEFTFYSGGLQYLKILKDCIDKDSEKSWRIVMAGASALRNDTMKWEIPSANSYKFDDYNFTLEEAFQIVENIQKTGSVGGETNV